MHKMDHFHANLELELNFHIISAVLTFIEIYFLYCELMYLNLNLKRRRAILMLQKCLCIYFFFHQA